MSPCTGGVNTVAQTTEGVEDKLVNYEDVIIKRPYDIVVESGFLNLS